MIVWRDTRAIEEDFLKMDLGGDDQNSVPMIGFVARVWEIKRFTDLD
jgi:hypothetical protein